MSVRPCAHPAAASSSTAATSIRERIILDDGFVTTPSVNVGDGFSFPSPRVVDYSFGNFKFNVTSVPAVIDNGLTAEINGTRRYTGGPHGASLVQRREPGGDQPAGQVCGAWPRRSSAT